MRQRIHRLNRVIQSSGDYFKGYHPPDDEEYSF